MVKVLSWIVLLLGGMPVEVPVTEVFVVPHLVVQAEKQSVVATSVFSDIFVVPGQADVRWSGKNVELVGRDLVHGVQFIKIPNASERKMWSFAETSPAVGQSMIFSGTSSTGMVHRVGADRFWVEGKNLPTQPGTPVSCDDGSWQGIVVGANPTLSEVEVLDATTIRTSYDENWKQ